MRVSLAIALALGCRAAGGQDHLQEPALQPGRPVNSAPTLVPAQSFHSGLQRATDRHQLLMAAHGRVFPWRVCLRLWRTRFASAGERREISHARVKVVENLAGNHYLAPPANAADRALRRCACRSGHTFTFGLSDCQSESSRFSLGTASPLNA